MEALGFRARRGRSARVLRSDSPSEEDEEGESDDEWTELSFRLDEMDLWFVVLMVGEGIVGTGRAALWLRSCPPGAILGGGLLVARALRSGVVSALDRTLDKENIAHDSPGSRGVQL